MPRRGFLFEIGGRDSLSPVARVAGQSLATLGQIGARALEVLASGAVATAARFTLFAVAIEATISRIRELTDAGIQVGREFEDLGDQLGVTAEEAAVLAFASSRTGIEVTELAARMGDSQASAVELALSLGLSAKEIEAYGDAIGDAAEVAEAIDMSNQRTKLALDATKAEFAGAFGGIQELYANFKSSLAEFTFDVFENLGDISATSGGGSDSAGGTVQGPEPAPPGYKWVRYRPNPRSGFVTELVPDPDYVPPGRTSARVAGGSAAYNEDAELREELELTRRGFSALRSAANTFDVDLELIINNERVVTLARQLQELAAGSEAAANRQADLNRAVASLDPGLNDFYEGGPSHESFGTFEQRQARSGFDPQGRRDPELAPVLADVAEINRQQLRFFRENFKAEQLARLMGEQLESALERWYERAYTPTGGGHPLRD